MSNNNDVTQIIIPLIPRISDASNALVSSFAPIISLTQLLGGEIAPTFSSNILRERSTTPSLQ
jgi:deoxyinosine 3'endonuclease (endonuclease V)